MKSGSWIAAQVWAKREFSVSSALEAKGYKTFVPAYTSVRRWSDRQKACELPLIAGYVFIRTAVEKTQARVVSTPGVMKLVAFGGEIASIDEQEIEAIRIVANSSLRREPWPYLTQNSPVKIARGALAGILGTVLQVKGNAMLVVSVEMLRRSVAVHIDRSWVEPVEGFDARRVPGKEFVRFETSCG